MRFMRSLFILAGFGVLSGLRAQNTVPTLVRAVPAQTMALNASSSIDLHDYFTLPGVTGQVVKFDTVLGSFAVEVLADSAPQNAANFLSYVRSNAYANS